MKFLTLIFCICLTAISYSQNVVTQLVEHGGSSPTGNVSSGCISVRLEVDYTVNGMSYISVSPTTQLDMNNSVMLSANLPMLRGVVVNARKVRVYGANDSHLYIMKDAPYNNYFNNGVDMCGPGSDFMNELETVSPSKFTFLLTTPLGSGK